VHGIQFLRPKCIAKHTPNNFPTLSCALYPRPPTNITSNKLAQSAMTTGPPNPTYPSDFTCLLSGPLDDFLLYSRQEHSRWLIDVSHDICDPALKRGSLQVWDVVGERWRNVNPTEPLTASIYLYDVQTIVSLSRISERTGTFRSTASRNATPMAVRVMERDEQQCWVSGAPSPCKQPRLPQKIGRPNFAYCLQQICISKPSSHTIYL
jgi:hypothetical protein